MSHTGLPMSPRNPPSVLSHTIATPVHPLYPSALAHSSDGLGLTSPPATPSNTSICGANRRLASSSRTFVPRAAKITVRKADGTEVSLEDLTKSTLTPSTPAVSSPQSLVLTQKAEYDSPELVERKVNGLLNELTIEKFDSISDQIIAWANKSEKEKDGRTLIQVIRLVFEKATDEATWSEMYARLCRKMMERISTNVQDYGIKNSEGKPIAGGQLFRKYLLNRCQDAFERGWVVKEDAAATKALEDEAANAKTKEGGTKEIVMYSDEYYAAQKAKRQGLGVIKFIGELFKLQMLTERIMHECVKKLLGNVDYPEEEEIESLCMLLATVGSMLDVQKARGHLDVYFSRMKELMKSPNVTPRMQYMLQDLLELRERKWVARNSIAAPTTTIAEIHENALKERAAQEVRRDGWAVAGSESGPPSPPPKAGDLSNLGQISKTQPLTFEPSSVFAGKKGSENKQESISGTNSNLVSMLNSQGAEAGDTDKVSTAEPFPQRKRQSTESTVQPLCVDPYPNLTSVESVVVDCPCQKKSDSSLATGSVELGKASPSPQSPVQCDDPPLTSAPPSVISHTLRCGRNYEAEWLRIRLDALQEDLHLQQRQFEEVKIAMNRHFEEQQENQRAQFDAERVIYQSQIKALREHLSDLSNEAAHRKVELTVPSL